MNNSITLTDGRTFRVELNWNAIVDFLASSGRDDMRELSNLDNLKPSDLAGLLAAGINEGKRLEGDTERMTAEDVGALSNAQTITEFIRIFTDQMTPKGIKPEAKKG
jgi:hypothetical protein